jgi:Flp pilus assembly protein TadB
MKGITNVQIREKFEHIESELSEIKEQKSDSSLYIIFFTFSAIMAVIATMMMLFHSHPLFLFFTILGISWMVFLIVFRLYEKYNQ